MARKNTVNQGQFRGKSAPQQSTDEWNRSYRTEPNPPSKSKKRDSVQLGSQIAARPGMVGMSDYPRKPKGKK